MEAFRFTCARGADVVKVVTEGEEYIKLRKIDDAGGSLAGWEVIGACDKVASGLGGVGTKVSVAIMLLNEAGTLFRTPRVVFNPGTDRLSIHPDNIRRQDGKIAQSYQLGKVASIELHDASASAGK